MINRLRLGVAYTHNFLHRIGQVATPKCPSCDFIETIHHILCDCVIYDAERTQLKNTLACLDNPPFSATKVLGAWDNPHKEAKATKAIVRFLKTTRLDFCF